MNEASFESEWRRFSQKRLSVKWQAARGDKEGLPRQTERRTVHSIFRRNDDASNMSLTDIPVGIPESANYRPEAHVFPFLYCIGFTPNLTLHRSALFPPFSFPFPFRLFHFEDTISRYDRTSIIHRYVIAKQLKI